MNTVAARVLLLVVMVIVALPSSLVTAQEGELPRCSEEELAVVVEVIEVYNEGIASLDEISTDANDAVYGAVVVGYNSFSSVFWDEVYPEFPECAEAQVIGITFGLAYDQLTIAAAYVNIAGWAVAAEDAETAEYFAERAVERIEETEGMIGEMETLDLNEILADSPTCTPEEYADTETALESFSTELDTLFNEMTMGTDSDIAAALATLVTIDAAAIVYWDDLYPEISGCAEAEEDALLFGLALDELTLISGLGVNAILEEAGGNNDIAASLLASAEDRFEDLSEMLVEMED